MRATPSPASAPGRAARVSVAGGRDTCHAARATARVRSPGRPACAMCTHLHQAGALAAACARPSPRAAHSVPRGEAIPSAPPLARRVPRRKPCQTRASARLPACFPAGRGSPPFLTRARRPPPARRRNPPPPPRERAERGFASRSGALGARRRARGRGASCRSAAGRWRIDGCGAQQSTCRCRGRLCPGGAFSRRSAAQGQSRLPSAGGAAGRGRGGAATRHGAVEGTCQRGAQAQAFLSVSCAARGAYGGPAGSP